MLTVFLRSVNAGIKVLPSKSLTRTFKDKMWNPKQIVATSAATENSTSALDQHGIQCRFQATIHRTGSLQCRKNFNVNLTQMYLLSHKVPLPVRWDPFKNLNCFQRHQFILLSTQDKAQDSLEELVGTIGRCLPPFPFFPFSTSSLLHFFFLFFSKGDLNG